MTITNGYADLPSLKQWLKINADDAQDDPILERAIETASRSIDRYTARRFYADTVATPRVFNPASGFLVYIDDVSTTNSLAVAIDQDDDGTYESPWTLITDYITEPYNVTDRPITTIRAMRLWLPTWWNLRPSVQVTAKWGWPSVPIEITQATLILATRIFKRKDSPEGVLGFGDLGAAVRISPNDKDVLTLIEPYRKWSVV